ncbi:MAG: hypothetical protein Q4D21_10645 [Phascolarctobacterium sp.]|nr:hypothetical protein [Phascolarctobacterium sp.]
MPGKKDVTMEDWVLIIDDTESDIILPPLTKEQEQKCEEFKKKAQRMLEDFLKK